GWLATGTADYSHSLGGLLGILPGSDSYTNMVRLSGTLSGYLPLGASVFALSLRGGRVLPLNRDSQTIGPKRFFLGGAASMRGYGEDEMIPEDVRGVYLDQVRACASSLSSLACTPAARQLAAGQFLASEGGESFVNAKAELRFPLRESVEMGLFADAGNLWLDPRVGSITDLRLNVGAGLRFLTPIGPAVLDIGLNPSPDERLGESYIAPHFSIGMF
ncbi:MAG TPA: BamA/TamA family outer membrane protein, partial [Anaeromyxobacteraceae bacterium]